MKQTFSSWVGTALCASVLMLAGCGDDSRSGSSSATASADPLAIQNLGFKMDTACAVRGDGAARCWGRNAEYWDQSKKAVTGPLKQLILDSSRFGTASCALNQEGRVFCWDPVKRNSLGRGALPDWGDPKVPVAVLSNVAQLDTSRGTVCALTNDGDVYCWGEGLADRPTKTMGLPKIKQVSIGEGHQCAVGVDSSLWCWGIFEPYTDGTGRSARFETEIPFRVEIPRGGATQVSVGENSSCAVTAHSGSVYCWGRNDYGEIGNNEKGKHALTPQNALLEDGEMAQQVSVGTQYACAMLTSGAARCWGNKVPGVLGNGEGGVWVNQRGSEPKPVKVQNSQGEFFGFKGIVAGLYIESPETTCAWGEGNQAWCWGSGEYGQLGDGDSGSNLYVNTPKRVKAIESGWI
jgi:alpha-tubulin suppressor-like RCC1 family protein